jgi:hypothetical protein
MPKQRTYAQIQAAVLEGLDKMGWEVKRGLKIPHATDPSRRLRLWFKPQSIYYDIDNGGRGNFNFASARSVHIDPKRLDVVSGGYQLPEAAVLVGWVSRWLVETGQLRAGIDVSEAL